MKRLLCLCGLAVITSCTSSNDKGSELTYTLQEEDGIFVEKFDSTVTDQNRYTNNNQVFQVGNRYTYSFEHLANDSVFYFESGVDKGGQDPSWVFVHEDEVTDQTIKFVTITVKSGLQPMIEFIPDYNQTVILFEYLSKEGVAPFNSSSGVIENEKNIWMHPPRDRYFQILELNPFPFIQAPYKEGNSWNWSLQIGEQWGDERWKTWEGNITNNYDYQIAGIQTIPTVFGDVECYVVVGTAVSELGTTGLITYFNFDLGFVKMNYINIDGSKTNLDLIKIVKSE